MKQKNERKRVACLYRVSTKKQVDGMEIPLQKTACLSFIEKNSGWILVKEYEEKGISAYKVKAESRDVLQEAMVGAKNNEFDILLVFKSDRLSRINSEFNQNIEAFCRYGIEVWSVSEGSIGIRTLEDGVISFFRGYTNETESLKISERTDAKHRQMVLEGVSRGGTLCYGYEYFKNGRYGGRDSNKRKELYDIRINHVEGIIVRDIFRMYVEKGYGGARIAKELNKNGIQTRENKEWKGQNINRMLKNPKYAGFDCYFKTSKKKGSKSYRQDKADWILSPQMKELQIIDDETWRKTESLLLERSAAFQSKMPQYPRKSELLFSGLIRCGHCGHMLRTVPLKRTWKRKDGSSGELKIYRYRCYYKASGGKCDGQTEYGKRKIEEVVMKEVNRYMDNLGNFDLSEDHRRKNVEELKAINKQLENVKKSLSEATREKEVLESEIAKALSGNSSFSPDQLSSAIRGKESEIQDLSASLNAYENKLKEKKLQNEDIEKVRVLSQTFRSAFDDMDLDDKKMVLKEIVDSIYVWRDRIEINMKIKISQLGDHLTKCETKMKVGNRTASVIEDSISMSLRK